MVGDSPEIDVDTYNRGDIVTYVEQRIRLGIAAQEPQWPQIRDSIVEKSGGIFLWAVLAVDGVLEKWAQGAGLRVLLKHLDILPQELFDLFSSLFENLSAETAELTLRLFQWAILSARPLQLQEWHHILGFISQRPARKSLKELRDSDHFTTTDEHLERRIRALSRGLLEFAVDAEEQKDTNTVAARSMSRYAGAGSFMMNPGETRIVQVIHESVREFFLANRGFQRLFTVQVSTSINDSSERPENQRPASIADGHLAIMNTCLDYLQVSELDALVSARIEAAKRDVSREPRISNLFEHLSATDLAAQPYAGHWEQPSLSHSRKHEAGADDDTYELLFCGEGIDIPRWINGVAHDSNLTDTEDINANHIGQEQHTALPSARRTQSRRLSLDSVKSQRLEDYPALLSYATDELFTHARQVRDQGRCSSKKLDQVLIRLGDERTWNRWLALREELHRMHPADMGGNLTKRPRSFMEYLLETDERFRGFLLRDLAHRTRSLGWDIVRCRNLLPIHSDSTCSSDSMGEYDITGPRYNYPDQGDAYDREFMSRRRAGVRKRGSLQSFRSAASVGSRASADERRQHGVQVP
ncbi:hypothetical protein QBC47DRAFT_410792 [Echria macrotheca]|uniref:Uncharacterized protein n=1 Tax=Echria macrotheca TaxID=438768 RepID=A0AAJ0F7K3_9PEZI|nr:hypothetical protein QBC47DRAFT_410792 [Echria macrotheca]